MAGLVEGFQYQGNNPDAAPTDAQLGFLSRLADERGVDEEELIVETFGDQGVSGLSDATRAHVSEMIEYLMQQPRAAKGS